MSEDEKIEDKSIQKTPSELISIKKSTYNKLIVGLIVAITVAAFLAGFGLGSDTDKDSNDETDRTSIKQPQAQSQPSSGNLRQVQNFLFHTFHLMKVGAK